MSQQDLLMIFPQYRKYTNGSSFFKILSNKEFIELQILGEKVLEYQVLAEQYPELRLINDMLELHHERWEFIDPIEFDTIKRRL